MVSACLVQALPDQVESAAAGWRSRASTSSGTRAAHTTRSVEANRVDRAIGVAVVVVANLQARRCRSLSVVWRASDAAQAAPRREPGRSPASPRPEEPSGHAGWSRRTRQASRRAAGRPPGYNNITIIAGQAQAAARVGVGEDAARVPHLLPARLGLAGVVAAGLGVRENWRGRG